MPPCGIIPHSSATSLPEGDGFRLFQWVQGGVREPRRLTLGTVTDQGPIARHEPGNGIQKSRIVDDGQESEVIKTCCHWGVLYECLDTSVRSNVNKY